MKKILTIILLTICTFTLKAQNKPEDVVKEYVRLLNDWLASPYDSQKKSKVENILQSGGEKCTMKDEIVEKFNSDAGTGRMLRDSYLTLLSDKTKENRVKVEIISMKDNSDNEGKIVTAILKYSGGINLKTASDFWISGIEISYIVSNDREILKIVRDNTNSEKTIHLLIFANTEDFHNGEIAQRASNYFRKEFANNVKRNTNFKINIIDLDSVGFQKIKAFSSNSNDVIFFYFGGYGFNIKDTPDFYPAIMIEPNNNYKSVWLRDVYNVLKSKPHNLLIAIAETCNNTISNNGNIRIGHFGLQSMNEKNYKILFSQNGNYLVISSKYGEYSTWTSAEPLGGFFLQSFKESFDNEVSQNNYNPSWENIFRNTTQKTRQKANKEAGLEQNPQWIKE